jgi:hypothetical protein
MKEANLKGLVHKMERSERIRVQNDELHAEEMQKANACLSTSQVWNARAYSLSHHPLQCINAFNIQRIVSGSISES